MMHTLGWAAGLVGFVTAFALASPLHADSAAVVNEVHLAPDEPARITQTVTLADGQDEVVLLSGDPQELQVEDSSGGQLNPDLEREEGYIGAYKFALQRLSGIPETTSVRIEYSAADVVFDDDQQFRTILPQLDGGLEGSWELKVWADGELPSLNYEPAIDTVTRDGNGFRYLLSDEEYDHPLVGLSFAESATLTVEQSATLAGRRPWPKMQDIFVPSDTHQQTAYMQEIDESVRMGRVDRDGNIIASYRSWPFQPAQHHSSWRVDIEHVRYDPTDAEVGAGLRGEHAYLAEPGSYWPDEGAVGEHAARIADETETAWDAAKQSHSWVQSQIAFDPDANGRLQVNEVIAAEAGSVEQAADVLVSLLRAQDIPARLVAGPVLPAAGVSQEGYHVWVEAYIDGVGWIGLDPFWAEIYNSFGYMGADRVALARISDDSQYEQLSTYEADYQIRSSDAAVEDEDEPQYRLIQEQFVVLPAVVFERLSVVAEDQTITDEFYLRESSDEAIGSLPPQLAVVLEEAWTFGGASQLPEGDDDERDIVVKVVRSWWPFWSVVGGVAAAIGGYSVLQLYRHRVKSYLKERTGGKLFH